MIGLFLPYLSTESHLCPLCDELVLQFIFGRCPAAFTSHRPLELKHQFMRRTPKIAASLCLPLLSVCPVFPLVSEVVQTLQLCTDRDQLDVVGDLSVCLDGMTVDPETFATAEANHQGESPSPEAPVQRQFWCGGTSGRLSSGWTEA